MSHEINNGIDGTPFKRSALLPRWGGGLLMRPDEQVEDRFATAQDETHPAWSWIGRVKAGDDQGRDGACMLFALANWSEVMFGKSISDDECLTLYWDVKKTLRRKTEGLSAQEGFAAARSAGWLPGMKSINKTNTLAAGQEQPLPAGYLVTPAWDPKNVSMAGCLDHTQPVVPRGLHAVLIVADGRGGSDDPDLRRVAYENSWGYYWGYKGLGVMRYDLHRKTIRGLWVLK